MNNIIDLHMHSTVSDGTDSPVRIVEKAKRAGIRTFSLTDHDSIDGAEYLMEYSPDGVTFIPGVEFSCYMDSGKCHILGYGFRPDNELLRDVIKYGRELRRDKLDKRIEFLADRGMCFPEEELYNLRRMPSVGKPHLGNLMVQYGYAPDRATAIDDILNQCPTGQSRVHAMDAIQAIIDAGGIPVWAHPLEEPGGKEVGSEKLQEMLRELMSLGIQGMECYYSKYSLAKCNSLAKIANENQIFISAGSDYHGMNKSVSLGTLNEDGEGIGLAKVTILPALKARMKSIFS